MSQFSEADLAEFKADGTSSAFDPVCSDDEEDNKEKDNFNGWVEEDELIEVKSLFSDKILPSIVDLVEFDKETFGFDLRRIVTTAIVQDDIAFIKLVNFIRATVKSWTYVNRENIEMLEQQIESKVFLEDDQNMIPQLENDPLLYLYEEAFSSLVVDEE